MVTKICCKRKAQQITNQEADQKPKAQKITKQKADQQTDDDIESIGLSPGPGGGEVQLDLPATAGVQSARVNWAAAPLTDSRGWIVIDVPPQSPTEGPIFLDTIISNKPLVLVRQRESMRVYVNPDRNKADEWEVPAGSGFRILVLSPQAFINQRAAFCVPAVAESV